MTQLLQEIALAAGGSLELSLLLKATAVVSLGLAVAAAARRARASRRHLVLATSFAVLLLLPAAATLVPPITIDVPAAAVPAGALSVENHAKPAAGAVTVSERRVDAQAAVEHVDRHSRFPPLTWLRVAWGAGAGLCLLPLLAMLWQLRTWRRTGAAWATGQVMTDTLARDIGLRRRVTVLLHGNVDAPMTSGLWRPVILLPGDASSWSAADLQRALLHELEHVRRLDWPMHLAARATCALYGCHPLVWVAWRRFHLDAERACDDAVAERTDRAAYAEQLVTLAGRLSAGVRPVLAMASGGDLSRRVHAVLNDGQARGRAGSLATVAALTVAIVVAAGLSPLRAVSGLQGPVAGVRRSFEAASIRRNISGNAPASIEDRNPSGRFTMTNVPLSQIVRWAFGIGRYDFRPFARIEGEPEWFSERFDIVAVAAPPVSLGGSISNPSLGDYHRMLQALLEERFELAARWEPRDQPVYELVLARDDGTLGPQLRPSSVDCDAVRAAKNDPARVEEREKEAARRAELLKRALATGDARLLMLPPPTCGLATDSSVPGQVGILSDAQPLSMLVSALARRLDRPVIDRTGLSGNFDVELRWAPRRTASASAAGAGSLPGPGIPAPVASEPAGPTLAEALRDQLGLGLVETRGPVEVLIIDHVERPTLD